MEPHESPDRVAALIQRVDELTRLVEQLTVRVAVLESGPSSPASPVVAVSVDVAKKIDAVLPSEDVSRIRKVVDDLKPLIDPTDCQQVERNFNGWVSGGLSEKPRGLAIQAASALWKKFPSPDLFLQHLSVIETLLKIAGVELIVPARGSKFKASEQHIVSQVIDPAFPGCVIQVKSPGFKSGSVVFQLAEVTVGR